MYDQCLYSHNKTTYFVLILFTRPNKKKSWLASLFSDFDGWVGGFNFYFSYFLIFFYLYKIKGRGGLAPIALFHIH